MSALKRLVKRPLAPSMRTISCTSVTPASRTAWLWSVRMEATRGRKSSMRSGTRSMRRTAQSAAFLRMYGLLLRRWRSTSGANVRAISADAMLPRAVSASPTTNWFMWCKSVCSVFVTRVSTSTLSSSNRSNAR